MALHSVGKLDSSSGVFSGVASFGVREDDVWDPGAVMLGHSLNPDTSEPPT